MMPYRGSLNCGRETGILTDMRIGLSTAAYYGKMETEDAAARVASMGISCCEVFLETFSEYSRPFGETVLINLGETRAVSIHAKTQHFETDIIGQSPRQCGDAFAWMEHFLQAGHALGAGIYVFHGPADLRRAQPDYRKWHEGIDRAIALSASYGIDFSWEVVSWCHLSDPIRVSLFRSLWPALHFVLDIKQIHDLRQNPLDYLKVMGSKLRHIHILDYDDQGRHALPGAGVSDYKELARALWDMDYQGDIILEPYAHIAKDDQALLDSIHWLQDTFLR